MKGARHFGHWLDEFTCPDPSAHEKKLTPEEMAEVVQRIQDETRWTNPAGTSSSVGMFQQLPSSWGSQ